MKILPSLRNALATIAKQGAIALFATVALFAATPVAHATETIIYLHNDVSGSPQAATDSSGNLLWKETYKPYGERTLNSTSSASGKGTNALYFHGKKVEALEGGVNLSYFGARYYDPSIGRFMGIDPAPFDPNSVHSFNRFAYGNNNPYKYVDPDGRSPVWVPMVIHIAGGAITGGATAGAINALGQLYLNGSVQWSGLGGVFDAASEGAQIGAIVGPMYAGQISGARAAATVDVITLSKSKYPQSAGHIEDAIRAGQPSTLTIDRAGATSRRRDALKGTPSSAGKDRDEYPPAMFKEGGGGSSVRAINPSDNRGAGACIGAQCRGKSDGTQVQIQVTQ